jgi:FkbM family methyltransferase
MRKSNISINFIIKSFLLSPLYFIGSISYLYNKLLFIIKPSLAMFWAENETKKSGQIVTKIFHKTSLNKILSLSFYTPNQISASRAFSFSSKEPETLKWIDNYGDTGVFFDIGANVGIYSIYFAKTQKSNVYAFEPSVFNLQLLAKNIYLNKLQKIIRVIPNPLSNQEHIEDFALSSINEGDAHSTFAVNYNENGNLFKKDFYYKTLGLSIDKMVNLKLLPETPAMIKIDVDGIEHLILQGAQKTIQNSKCRTILIETNPAFKLQRDRIYKILTKSGFYLSDENVTSKKTSKSITYNQIWLKL